MDQCEIYDAESILNRLLIDSAPFETVETLAFGLIEESEGAEEGGRMGTTDRVAEAANVLKCNL